MSILTEDLILQKTKCDSLTAVKMLNLWGSSLRDISIVSRMPNAEVLSLTMNQIASLEPFTHLPKLRELYLRKNDIRSLDDLPLLGSCCPHLRVLWLCDNPCANSPTYRLDVIRAVPQIQTLDNETVTTAERATAAAQPSTPVNQSRALPPAASSPRGVTPIYTPAPSSATPPPRPPPSPGVSSPTPDSPRRSAAPQTSAPPTNANSTGRSNILYAVLALLKELTPEEKDIVRRELRL
jgi:hypothetical protein